jgi:hypothetical protein
VQSFSSRAEILAWAEQDGVDLSQLRERLRRSPTERMQQHMVMFAFAEALRNAGKAARQCSKSNAS